MLDIKPQKQFCDHHLSASVIHRIAGCLVGETTVLKHSTKSTKRLGWRSTGNRSKSSSSFCPRKKEAGREGTREAEALTHLEVAGLASLRMKNGRGNAGT